MSLALASIHVYPVKSLGGFPAMEARLTDRGLRHDRRWMLVDEQGAFLSQRKRPVMACLHCAPHGDGYRVTDVRSGENLDLPWSLPGGNQVPVSVWGDALHALEGDAAWNDWFSGRLGCRVRLVYMPDAAERPTDSRFAQGLTSLSDGFPYLIVSQASLDDLNTRLGRPIPMDRFRPNLVIGGGAAFQEDGWTSVMIGEARFELVKPCARCVITTTDQRTGQRGEEPLRTLATFRAVGNQAIFGMNAVSDARGVVRVGDLVAPCAP